MNLAKITPPVVKPNTEISITVSKNNNLTTVFYSNGSTIYYTAENSLCSDKETEIFQLNPIQSNASITALVNITIPNTKRDVLFVGDSQGKLTVIELLLGSEEKFKLLKEIQVFNAIISEIVVDNTGSKVFISGAVNMNANTSNAAKNDNTLLRFLNWELGNSVGDPIGLNGPGVALTFASEVKNLVDSRVTVADAQGTLIFYTASNNGTGYKFVKSFKDSNSQYRGTVKDLKYSPSSNSDVEEVLATFGSFQRSKQGIPVRGKYLVACYSDKRLKLFNGDDGCFVFDLISDIEIQELTEIKGGWSLIQWLTNDIFLVSGKCGTRIYQIKKDKSSELLFNSQTLKLYGLAFENENLVGVQADGSLIGLKLSEGYSEITEHTIMSGVNKPINHFSEDLIATIDGQLYNFKEKLIYSNEDNIQIVLLNKLDEDTFISLNKKGTLTTFSTKNGIKNIIKKVELNTGVLMAKFDASKDMIAFVDFEFNLKTIALTNNEILEIPMNRNNDEITEIQIFDSQIYVATFHQQNQEAKIFKGEELLLTHKSKISHFLVSDGFITFSDFTGKTQIQCLKDDLELQGKKFKRNDIIVSVNKWSHHSGKITSMAWKPTSKSNINSEDAEPLLATVGLDNSLVVYSLKKTIKPKFKVEQCHKTGIVGTLWTSENQIITFGLDGCIKHWNL